MFLFDSLGLDDFKVFVVNNDEAIINDLLYNFKKCESKSTHKLKLYAMKFCVMSWQKMSHKKKSINRNCSKPILSDGTICNIKKESMHEQSNIRK